MTGWKALYEKLERYADLLVVFAVVGMAALMVVRVPQELLDGLIAVNLGVALTVLLLSLYIRDALRLPSFPTILLITTLFRLALNVSSTKLILLDADAGRIIQAFGEVVVGGNPVVGGVVFLVLVLIQFIVIAKGSERVAEVSARFTLDAMPGKQSSIDYDQQNRLITGEQARARRRDLERESKLYGAMDGAMKFVKGDAIAGIIISLVNILGGLVVGTLQHGMSLSEAATTYTLLTIGDGLVSQLPSLLISLAAGLVVTRVAADDGGQSNLGLDLVRQILRNPRALAIGSGAFLLFGLVNLAGDTGFPAWPFLLLGAASALCAGAGTQAAGAREADLTQAGADAGKPQAPTNGFLPLPIVIEHHFLLRGVFSRRPDDPNHDLRELLNQIRARVSLDLGVPLPEITIREGNLSLPAMHYRLLLHDAPAGEGRMLEQHAAFVACGLERAREQGVEAEPFIWPGRAIEGVKVDAAAAERLADFQEHRTLFANDLFLDHIERALRRNVWRLIGIQETHRLLETLEKHHRELVAAVHPKRFSLQEIADVLAVLLKEQIPIRDLRQILEALARWRSEDRRPELIAEHVRHELRKTLFHRYCGGARQMEYYALSPEFEDRLSDVLDGRLFLDGDRLELEQALEQAIPAEHHLHFPPILLIQRPEVRPIARAELGERFPELIILLLLDAPGDLELVSRGVIGAGGAEGAANHDSVVRFAR